MLSLHERVNGIEQFLLDKTISDSNVTTTTFSQKYRINLPFQDDDTFVSFNGLLNANQLMKMDFHLLLQNFIDKALIVTKCLVSMIKMLLTKTVASNYSASRLSNQKDGQKPEKKIFKHTVVCKIMFDVITKARKKFRLDTAEKELLSGLSDVLTNVHKWKQS